MQHGRVTVRHASAKLSHEALICSQHMAAVPAGLPGMSGNSGHNERSCQVVVIRDEVDGGLRRESAVGYSSSTICYRCSVCFCPSVSSARGGQQRVPVLTGRSERYRLYAWRRNGL